MKLGIVGSRYVNNSNFDEFSYLVRRYIYHHGNKMPSLIITGDSEYIDAMAYQYSLEYNIPCIMYKDHNKDTRISRNQKMMDVCTHMIIMPSCTHDSPDAWDVIRLALKYQKYITILYM